MLKRCEGFLKVLGAISALSWVAKLLWLGVSIVAMLLIGWWQTMPLYMYILLLIGFLMIVLGIILGISKWVRGKSKTREQIGGLQTIEETVGIEYYPTRRNLDSIKDEFANVDKAWVLWYTGSTAIDQGVYHYGKIKRMIFIHPECNFRREVKEHLRKHVTGGRSPEEQSEKIRHFTRMVYEKAKNIEIGWLNDVPDYFFVINNPDSDDAWVRIESCDLNRNANDWHSYRIYRREHRYLFEVLKRKYEQLWERSEKYDGAKNETPTKEKGKKGGET